MVKSSSAGSTWVIGASRGFKSYVFAAMLVAGFCLALLGSARAEAATTYESSGSFGSGELANPSKLAVDDATGNVLVVDREHSRIAVYDSAGAAATPLAEFGSGELSFPYGIAIDQSNGDVYVSDQGNGRIAKYASDGADPPTYTAVSAPSFSSPTGIGSYASPLAVDPTTGDLLIADRINREVKRFSASGAFISSFNGAQGTPLGSFEQLQDIAVDSNGTIYLVDLSGGFNEIFGTMFGSAAIRRYGSDGSSQGLLSTPGMPEEVRSIGADPDSGNLIATLAGGSGRTQGAYVFHNGFFLDHVAFPPGAAESAVVGTAAGGGSTDRLYALTNSVLFETVGTTGVQVFDPVTIPDVSIEAPSAVTPTGAHLQGTINPQGQPTSYRFEYLADGATSWSKTPTVELGSGGTPEPVQADITGLEPNTEYKLRLIAVTATRSVPSNILDFSTLPAAPAVITEAPQGLTAASAELRGRLNPFGQQAGYHFEYGTTTAYGSRAPAKVDAVAGNGRVLKAVAVGVTGLSPATTYHFRLVAQNATGTSTGDDVGFTTPSAAELQRSYEQVTPVEKNGMVPAQFGLFGASASGDTIVIRANAGADRPDTESGPRLLWYASNRTPAGWSFRQFDVGQSPTSNIFLASTLAISEDGSRALVASNQKLTSDSIDNGANMYIRDAATGALQLIASSAESYAYNSWTGYTFDGVFYGGSADFSTVFIDTGIPLVPGAPPGDNIYEWTNGELTLASLLPDGSPMPGPSGPEPYGGSGSFNPVSRDGSRVYFASGSAGVFLRENGEMVPISVSHRPGDPATVQPGYLIGTSPDGRYASFTVASESGLTPDAPDAAWDVYRYDRQTETLEYAFNSAGYGGVTMSDEGDSLWKISGSSFRVWHEGVVNAVAIPASESLFSAASPDGRYIALTTATPLTGYDNSNPQACVSQFGGGKCREVYVYDVVGNAMTCASCPADGSPSMGMANSGGPRKEIEGPSHHLPNVISNAGQVFFDTPTRLVGGDENGSRDVYEYQDGQVRLVSAGAVDTVASFIDSSFSGRDVFFATDARLVGQDQDNLFDVYDARVGGGIAAQNFAPPPGGCSGGGDCRATTTAAPPAIAVGSETLTGPGSSPARPRKRCHPHQGQKAKRAKARCSTQNQSKSPRKGASAR